MNTYSLLLVIIVLQLANLIIVTKPFWERKPEDMDEDELYEEAKTTVVAMGKASTSLLQRKLAIGYARAARLMDMLEENKVISKGEGSEPRKVLGIDTI